MGESILSRASGSSPVFNTDNPTLTQRQAQVDSGVSSATRQLSDPIFIASSIAGAGAYAATRWGTAKAGRSLINKSLMADINYIKSVKGTGLWWNGQEVIGGLFVPEEFAMKYTLMSLASRFGSYGLPAALGSSTQEFTYRSLSSLTEAGPKNPHLWHWNGEAGIKNGLIQALCTVGPAYLSSELGLRIAKRVYYKPPSPLEKVAIGAFTVSSFAPSYSLFDYLMNPKDSKK